MQISTSTIFHANGKLLLTGEYFLLDGALGLALPVRLGQSLECQYVENQSNLTWQSFDEKKVCWFEAAFETKDFTCLHSTDEAVAARLQKILREASQLVAMSDRMTSSHPVTCIFKKPAIIKTRLTFPRQWGLGTSSTLIYCVAQWAKVDAFKLQYQTFGGSGYDIACAGANNPILYQLKNRQPQIESCHFEPSFGNSLYFIYLGKKQDSREGIARYRKSIGRKQTAGRKNQALVDKISLLTREFLAASTLADFEKLIREHERLVGETVKLPRAKHLFFSDFWGEIKSLGAWGGDFVLATSHRPAAETQAYFTQKGFAIIFPYFELALPPAS